MAFKAITANTPPEQDAHIMAEDDAAIYEGLIGIDRVLNIGNKLNASVITNNKVRISDGVVMVGGHAGRLVKGDYEDMTIENGVSGQKRNDLIVARFLHGETDTYKLAVVKGAYGSTAVDPAVTRGNLYAGDVQRDYPLWRVRIEGLSIVKLERLYEIGLSNQDLEDEVKQLNTNLSGMGKYCQWGKYGREWQLTNTYGNIGSTLPAVNDDLYSSTTGNIASVTVKKAGTYLVNFNGSYTGNSVVWAQLAIGSATEFEYTTQCNSYASLNFSRILHLEAGQRVTINISGASGYVVKSDGKELAQVLCLSLD